MNNERIDNSELTERITAALTPFVKSGAVVGVIAAVADKTKILAETTLGFADRDRQVPMTSDALFWVASQTKPITATALMMLVDEKRLTLDDPVEAILSEFQDLWVIRDQDAEQMTLTRPVRPITVRDILSHMSGMTFRSRIEEPVLDAVPLPIAVRSYAATPLLCQPGTRYGYSNMGISMAGRVIEVLSGMAYETFLQERLLTPLGMRDTTFWPDADQQRRLAKTYRPNREKMVMEEVLISQLHYPLDSPTRYPMPAGGLFSSTQDMIVFCQMLLNGGTYGSKPFISPESIMQMTTRQTPPDPSANYGLGWELGDGYYRHGGACRTSMSIHPGHDCVLVYMVQHDGFFDDDDPCRTAFEKAALGD